MKNYWTWKALPIRVAKRERENVPLKYKNQQQESSMRGSTLFPALRIKENRNSTITNIIIILMIQNIIFNIVDASPFTVRVLTIYSSLKVYSRDAKISMHEENQQPIQIMSLQILASNRFTQRDLTRKILSGKLHRKTKNNVNQMDIKKSSIFCYKL